MEITLRYVYFQTTITDGNEISIRDDTLEKIPFKTHTLINQIVKNDYCALAVFDRELRYLYVSDQFLQDYQITRENVIGKSQYNIFPDMPERWKIAYTRALEGESSSSEEDTSIQNNGKFLSPGESVAPGIYLPERLDA